jgi:hypothetical protein
MTLDWSSAAAVTVILGFFVALIRWVQSAFATRDEEIAKLKTKVAVLESRSADVSAALVSAEQRTASAMEGLRTDVKHMADRLDELFKLIINERDR